MSIKSDTDFLNPVDCLNLNFEQSLNIIKTKIGSKNLNSFEGKCTVIPCCVQTERITVTPEIERRAEEIRQEYAGKTLSFSVGRLVPYKGFKYLLEASEYLDNDFAVLIAGEGWGRRT